MLSLRALRRAVSSPLTLITLLAGLADSFLALLLLWTGVLIVSYYVVQKPGLLGTFAGLLDTIWTLLVAALLWARRRPGLRRPLGFSVGSGLLFWLVATMSLTIYEQGTRLPEIELRNAEGETVNLADYQGGPLVINLWATWCPPCRREMPVLEEAQKQRPDLTFLFVNQAESMQSVSTYLATQGLSLTNVLFDGSGRLGQAVGSMALPTTLFYSADGRLLASHLGELSEASLARALENFETPGSTTAAHPATRTLPCPASTTC